MSNISQIREQMSLEGFSSEEIDGALSSVNDQMLDEGFTQEEISAAMGVSKAPIEKELSWWREVGNDVFGTERDDIPSFTEFLEAGWQQSVTGLVARGKGPDINLPSDAPIAQRVAAEAATLVGDAPAMVLGAVAGASGAVGAGNAGPQAFLPEEVFTVPTFAMAGAFALPMGLRQTLMDSYEKGDIDSFGEFWERVQSAGIETFKGLVTGASTAIAGPVAGRAAGAAATRAGIQGATKKAVQTVAATSAELTTMVTVGSALEGRVPEPQEFFDAAVLLAGAKGAQAVATSAVKPVKKTLRDVYRETGKRPKEVLSDIGKDPSIKADIMADRVPVAYRNIVEAERSRYPQKPQPEPETPSVARDREEFLSKISVGEKEVKAGATLEDIYTATIDDLHPINKFTKAMRKGEDLPAEGNPYVLARLSRGNAGRSERMLQFEAVDFASQKVVGKGMRQILKPVQKDLDGFRAFLTAQRVSELEKKGVKTGFDLTKAEAIVKVDSKRYGKVAEELRGFQNNMLRYLKDSGVLSEKSFKKLTETNKFYIPFHRVFENGDVSAFGRGMKVFDPIRRIKGSERDIIDPLESIVKNTFTFVEIAERNRVLKSLTDLAGTSTLGAEFIRPSKPPISKVQAGKKEAEPFLKDIGADLPEDFTLDIFRADPKGLKANQFAVYENGKRKIFEANDDIIEAISGMNSRQSSLLVRMLSVPTKTLRAGVTLDPTFMARNISRDQLSAFLQSENNYIPLVSGFKGLAHLAGRTNTYKEWLSGGGAQSSLLALDRNYLQTNLQSVLQSRPVINEISNPLDFLRMVSSATENMTRLGEFAAGRKKGKSIFQAAQESREVTIDFARKGGNPAVQAAAQVTAFLNPKIQGVDRLYRAFKQNPARYTARATAGLILPSATLYALNSDRQWYKDLQDWQRDLYWHVEVDDTIYRIPKPFEPGVIYGSGTERFMEYIKTNDPEAFKNFSKQLLGAFDPVGLLPTAAVPVIEQFANESLLTGSPLIPRGKEDLLPEYQYRPYTTEVTKMISRGISEIPGLENESSVSPIIIENYVRQWTGGLGMTVLKGLDELGINLGALPDPNRPEKVLSDMPVVGAFVLRNPTMGTKWTEDFYKKFNENQVRINTVKQLLKTPGKQQEGLLLQEQSIREGKFTDMSSYKRAISDNIKMLRAVEEMKDIDPAEKRQMMDDLYTVITNMTREGVQQFEYMEEKLKEFGLEAE